MYFSLNLIQEKISIFASNNYKQIKFKALCQTNLISSNIVRLSTRSYKQRLDAATPNGCSIKRLVRLNKDFL